MTHEAPNDAIDVVHRDGSYTISGTNIGSHALELKRRILRNGGGKPNKNLTETIKQPYCRRRLYCRSAIGNDTDLHRVVTHRCPGSERIRLSRHSGPLRHTHHADRRGCFNAAFSATVENSLRPPLKPGAGDVALPVDPAAGRACAVLTSDDAPG